MNYSKEELELVNGLIEDYSLYAKPERITPYEALYQSRCMLEVDGITLRASVIYYWWNTLYYAYYRNH